MNEEIVFGGYDKNTIILRKLAIKKTLVIGLTSTYQTKYKCETALADLKSKKIADIKDHSEHQRLLYANQVIVACLNDFLEKTQSRLFDQYSNTVDGEVLLGSMQRLAKEHEVVSCKDRKIDIPLSYAAYMFFDKQPIEYETDKQSSRVKKIYEFYDDVTDYITGLIQTNPEYEKLISALSFDDVVNALVVEKYLKKIKTKEIAFSVEHWYEQKKKARDANIILNTTKFDTFLNLFNEKRIEEHKNKLEMDKKPKKG